jgi:hypothetical protein
MERFPQNARPERDNIENITTANNRAGEIYLEFEAEQEKIIGKLDILRDKLAQATKFRFSNPSAPVNEYASLIQQIKDEIQEEETKLENLHLTYSKNEPIQ